MASLNHYLRRIRTCPAYWSAAQVAVCGTVPLVDGGTHQQILSVNMYYAIKSSCEEEKKKYPEKTIQVLTEIQFSPHDVEHAVYADHAPVTYAGGAVDTGEEN